MSGLFWCNILRSLECGYTHCISMCVYVPGFKSVFLQSVFPSLRLSPPVLSSLSKQNSAFSISRLLPEGSPTSRPIRESQSYTIRQLRVPSSQCQTLETAHSQSAHRKSWSPSAQCKIKADEGSCPLSDYARTLINASLF